MHPFYQKCQEFAIIVVLNFLTKNWKAIALAIGAIVVACSMTTILVSNYKDKVHAEFLKRHDAELARKLTDEFIRKMEDFKSQADLAKQDLIAKIKDLCAEYKLSTSLVLKPRYA